MDMISFRSLIDSSDRVASQRYIDQAVLLRAAPVAEKKAWEELLAPHMEKLGQNDNASKPGINEFLTSSKIRKN